MANKDVVGITTHKGKLVTVTEGGKIREVPEERKDLSYPRRHRGRNKK